MLPQKKLKLIATTGRSFLVPLEAAKKQCTLLRLMLEDDGGITATATATPDEGGNSEVTHIDIVRGDEIGVELLAEFIRIRGEKDVPPPPKPLPSYAIEEYLIPMELDFIRKTILLSQGMVKQRRLMSLMVVADFVQNNELVAVLAAFLTCQICTANVGEIKSWTAEKQETTNEGEKGASGSASQLTFAERNAVMDFQTKLALL